MSTAAARLIAVGWRRHDYRAWVGPLVVLFPPSRLRRAPVGPVPPDLLEDEIRRALALPSDPAGIAHR